MRVLIACEESATVREAFKKLGHDAWSCDILPSRIEGNHLQGDVLQFLHMDWDMMIAFPPCTDLAVSGAKYFQQKREDGRQIKAIGFFMNLISAPIPLIAVENPVGIMSNVYRKPDQIIQPYQFGHDASKKTCLWLKGLPLLQPTKYVEPRIVNGKKRWGNQTDNGQFFQGIAGVKREDRAKVRSQTYQGIAEAMAEQWTCISIG